MNDPETGYAMPKMPQQTKFNFAEADEIDPDDLEAAAEKFDDIKANPDKYFTTKYHDARKIVLAIEKAARSCIDKSEKINTEVSGNWTNRRQSFADSAARKKERLIKWAKMLNTLAIMWDANDVPDLLSKIRSATDIEWVFYHGYPSAPDKDSGDWYLKDYPALLKKATKLGLTSKEDAIQMRPMLESLGSVKLTSEQEKEKFLKEKMKEIHRDNIPGFYPTPGPLIDLMLEHADIQDGMKILEPSAGIGSICDKIKEQYPSCRIECCERMYSLAEILMLKGYHVCANDIFDMVKVEEFDRIIMNPPFEKGQDIEHVMFCFNKFLKHGGQLVSIMSSGVISGNSARHIKFTDFRAQHHACYINNGQAFKDSFNSTGVSSIILVITK